LSNSVEVKNADAVGNAVALWNMADDLYLWVPGAWVKPSTIASHPKRLCSFGLKVTRANPESRLSILAFYVAQRI
jgi:hypothetical protein